MSPSGRSGRRRWLWWVLAAAFVVVPLAEIYLLVQLGQVIGAWWTVLLLVADGVLGSLLVRREGGRTWRALQAALAAHRMPATELADGALVLIGGTLLLTPGFLSDVVGLFCILPFTRPVARRVLAGVITRRLRQGVAQGVAPRFPFGAAQRGARPRSGPTQPGPARGGTVPPRGGHEVVPGEVVDDG